MSHDTDANPNPTPLGERSERIQRLRQAMRHPKILAADGWYTQEDDRIAPTDREYIAACDPATISELLSELDELWRIAGAYRPQKELADALNKSKSSRADAMNRLNAEQAKRLTLQHHAADLAQRVADLTAERDELRTSLAEAMQECRDTQGRLTERQAECRELRAERDRLLRERDELTARERTCPTMLEAEARALMRALQAVAAHVGLGLDASPHQVVDAVGSMAARLAEIERAEPVAVVGDTYSLLWAQPGTMPEIVRRCGIKVGSLLYARPTQAAAPAQAAPAMYIGACITDGTLHATVMSRDAAGNVTCVGQAEMDATSLVGRDCLARMSPPPADEPERAEPTSCQADRDGDCRHPHCPQQRDGEPQATGRHCPIDAAAEARRQEAAQRLEAALDAADDDEQALAQVEQLTDEQRAWARLCPLIERHQIGISPPSSPVHRNGGPNAGWGKSGFWGGTAWVHGLDQRPVSYGKSSALEVLEDLAEKLVPAKPCHTCGPDGCSDSVACPQRRDGEPHATGRCCPLGAEGGAA